MAKLMNAIGKVALDEYRGVHPHVSGLIENPRQIDQLMERPIRAISISRRTRRKSGWVEATRSA
jgi:hypothetical protein